MTVFSGWAGLGRFWIAVLVALLVATVVLQSLGPPVRESSRPRAGIEPPPAPRVIHPTPAAVPADGRPGRDTPGPVSEPDPTLGEPYRQEAGRTLPRVSALDGRAPMQVYAAGFDRSTRRVRVALMIAGIGLNDADSLATIKALPPRITLAVSPYAANPNPVLAAARMAEMEYLASIPMEPNGYPLNDPDSRHALMTDRSPEDNMAALRWAMSRFDGYVGMTSVLGTMRGERLVAMADQFDAVASELGQRGLLYVGAPPSASPPGVWSRIADLVIDDPPGDANEIDLRLARLNQLAKDRNGALGLVLVPRPVTIERVAAWANGLGNQGMILTPVSALVTPPAARKPTE